MPSCIKEESPYSGTPRLTLINIERDRSSRGQSDWSRLMARAQDGDRDAYRILLTEIEPYIRSIAIGYLSRSPEMEDAVQARTGRRRRHAQISRRACKESLCRARS
jgi:hypothetical protein